MFATCLFCNGALGANEALEHFPVGRRIAYDVATGRLWVVCHKCERWNLSPLDSRWEAIEEAERAFRGTKLRVATDNIGLARVSDGTELVRIGVPPPLEFAAWRYGDQFGKRHRKTMGYVALGAAVAITPLIGQFAAIPVLFGGGMTLSFAKAMCTSFQLTRHRDIPIQTVHNADGAPLHLTRSTIGSARLINASNSQWALEVEHVSTTPASGLLKTLGYHEVVKDTTGKAVLTGSVAKRALGTMMPRVNIEGGSRKNVNSAVALINESSSIGNMLRNAPVHSGEMRNYFKLGPQGAKLFTLPAALRLALEMALHADDERRAMEGELIELEARWREADAIARIADNMFLPDDIDERVEALQRRSTE
jgi:hypothetical protein